jgi:hypothetical protein
VQDITAGRGQFQNQDYWSVRKDGLTEVCVAAAGCVAACLQICTQNQHSDMVSRFIVREIHFALRFVSPFLCSGEENNSFLSGSRFQN